MKFGIITDQHFGVRGDDLNFFDYYEEFYSNVFFPELEKRNIKTLLILGDTFERRKFTNHNTLYKSKQIFFNKLAEYNIETHCIIGNHDVAYKNTNKVNAPELFLQEYDNITTYAQAEQIEIGGMEILMVPWINKENNDHTMELMKTTSAQVLLGHLEIIGFDMYPGYTNEEGLESSIFSKFEFVGSGHLHHRSTKGNITYFGSPYETTWSDFGDPRGFHIFDTSDRTIEFIQNPYKMFNKIFYDDSTEAKYEFEQYKNKICKVIVVQKNKPLDFDLFMDRLMKEGPHDVQVVDDHLDLMNTSEEELGDAEDTMSIVRKYIGEIDIPEPDKKGVYTLFNTLYNEALTPEK
jgi:DNA repair exonuclease SbcCD nuclease subunit